MSKNNSNIKEFANIDIGTYLNSFVKDLKLELENSSEETKK